MLAEHQFSAVKRFQRAIKAFRRGIGRNDVTIDLLKNGLNSLAVFSLRDFARKEISRIVVSIKRLELGRNRFEMILSKGKNRIEKQRAQEESFRRHRSKHGCP